MKQHNVVESNQDCKRNVFETANINTAGGMI